MAFAHNPRNSALIEFANNFTITVIAALGVVRVIVSAAVHFQVVDFCCRYCVCCCCRGGDRVGDSVTSLGGRKHKS